MSLMKGVGSLLIISWCYGSKKIAWYEKTTVSFRNFSWIDTGFFIDHLFNNLSVPVQQGLYSVAPGCPKQKQNLSRHYFKNAVKSWNQLAVGGWRAGEREWPPHHSQSNRPSRPVRNNKVKSGIKIVLNIFGWTASLAYICTCKSSKISILLLQSSVTDDGFW